MLAALVSLSAAVLMPHTMRCRSVVVVMSSVSKPSNESDDDDNAYLARHPSLKDDLIAALDHALTTRAEDPKRAIADHLLRGLPSPAAVQIPAPSACPHEGRQFSGNVPERAHAWVLWWNHFANLDHSNENILSGLPLSELPQSTYPVRMAASAGFRREWSRAGGEGSSIGQQTSTNLRPVAELSADANGAEVGARAHAMVGVLVPLTERCFGFARAELEQRGMMMERVPVEHFEWLGWQECPSALSEVWVPVPRVDSAQKQEQQQEQQQPHAFPTFELPILQSHIDTLMLGALAHGESFAAEWLESIEGWSSFWLNDRLSSRRPWVHLPQATQVDRLLKLHPPSERNMYAWRAHPSEYTLRSGRPHCGGAMTLGEAPALVVTRAPRRVATNFLIGFGSLLQTASRRRSNHAAVDAAPCRIKSEFGFVREWNFRAPTAQICALGLRRVEEGEVGATINGVCFPAPDDLSEFDQRENGYQRVQVPREMVELLGWQTLPSNACIFVYVPFAYAATAGGKRIYTLPAWSRLDLAATLPSLAATQPSLARNLSEPPPLRIATNVSRPQQRLTAAAVA